MFSLSFDYEESGYEETNIEKVCLDFFFESTARKLISMYYLISPSYNQNMILAESNSNGIFKAF